MATIEAQLELEARIMQRTSERFHKNNDDAETKGRASGTDYARRLHKIFLDDLVVDLDEYCTKKLKQPGPGGKYIKLVQRIDPYVCVQVALQEMFNTVSRGGSLQDTMSKVGIRIEDDIKFGHFKAKEPEYFNTVVADFKARGTTEYRHIHRVLTKKMREFNVAWLDWTSLERVKVGEVIVKIILECTPLFEVISNPRRGKNTEVSSFTYTAYAVEWIDKFKEFAQYLRPLGAPCIVPPKDWEDMYHGGFYSPELQAKFPFIRTRHHTHVEDGNFTEHMQAVNKIQATAWMINPVTRDFLNWATENNYTTKLGMPAVQPFTFPLSPFPNMVKEDMTEDQQAEFLDWKRQTARLHTAERKRFSEASAIWRLTTMADDYAQYQRFYFVYTCDFRGRIYPVTSGLSPQGADYSKGLLKFAQAKTLGKDGWFWLRVHGANLYGYDKGTYIERVEYITGMKERIIRAGDNPRSGETVSLLSEADKPLQFLAFCREYSDALKGNPEEFKSYLPVGLDGSCNGLQNFSAILRDEVAGLATNVLPNTKPNDIYGEVADVAIESLTKMAIAGCAVCKKVLTFAITRKTTKRSVMTLPYGLTKHSSGLYIGDWLYDEYPDAFTSWTARNEAKNVLNGHVWDAIGEVVTSARVGMTWLQEVAKAVGREGMPLIWTTPTGFKVYQEDNKSKTRRFNSTLADVTQMTIREWTDKIDTNALSNGSAPNYIHSMDAAHLVKTVLEGAPDWDWVMIHDDFGTHACNITELHGAIRRAFYKMYTGVDRLDVFRREIESYINGELPTPPTMGTMNICDVLQSKYFFG